MNTHLRLVEPTSPIATPATERAAYVAELRARFLDGTLDEVLIPDTDVPDRLLKELFPTLFGANEDEN